MYNSQTSSSSPINELQNFSYYIDNDDNFTSGQNQNESLNLTKRFESTSKDANNQIVTIMPSTFFPYFDFKPSFPPQITPQNLLFGKSNNMTNVPPSKPPNSFIIYRIVAIKELKSQGCNGIHMTKISGLISAWWKKEPENVKAFYKNLAQEATRLYKIMFPKKKKRNVKNHPISNTLFNNSEITITATATATGTFTFTSTFTSTAAQNPCLGLTSSQTEQQAQAQTQLSNELIPINAQVDRFLNATIGSLNGSFQIGTSDSCDDDEKQDSLIQPLPNSQNQGRKEVTFNTSHQTPMIPLQFLNLTQYHQEVFIFHFHLLHHGNPYANIADAQLRAPLFKFHVI
ncbi:hypothetical protein G9A89_020332 [Geosiphon pyriformis]|nr:hypothetical protein G9A89_020332 [Geosiphon pyriformis]